MHAYNESARVCEPQGRAHNGVAKATHPSSYSTRLARRWQGKRPYGRNSACNRHTRSKNNMHDGQQRPTAQTRSLACDYECERHWTLKMTGFEALGLCAHQEVKVTTSYSRVARTQQKWGYWPWQTSASSGRRRACHRGGEKRRAQGRGRSGARLPIFVGKMLWSAQPQVVYKEGDSEEEPRRRLLESRETMVPSQIRRCHGGAPASADLGGEEAIAWISPESGTMEQAEAVVEVTEV